MARPRQYGDRIGTQVRLSPELHERLMASAAEREVSANVLVVKAIEQFLDRLIPLHEFTASNGSSSSFAASPLSQKDGEG